MFTFETLVPVAGALIGCPALRLIRHEVIADCGSYEVRADGKPSRYFYFDDLPSRRLRPEVLTKAEAPERTKKYARAERGD